MSPSGIVLVVAVILVGTAFVAGTWHAARRRFPDRPGQVRAWAGAAAVFFVGVAAIDLGLASSGVLARFDRLPPPFGLFLLFNLGLAFLVARSRLGSLLATGLSWRALVGFHSFRFLAELALFLGLGEGLAPRALTVEGWNFDILTAITASMLYFHLRRRESLALVRGWNRMGLFFLGVIFFIAVGTSPTPLRIFHEEPSNAWVAQAPYVLLPGILVLAALTGHLILLRKLREEAA